LIFTESPLGGAFVIDLSRLEDQRGYFARTWCQREFEERGLNATVVQCNLSVNRKRGTWRGMHYQEAPFEEAKLVRCTSGALWDVIVDLRTDSPTFKRHFGLELSAKSGRMLYVPETFAHGFITLEDDTEVFYQMSQFHEAESARGFRWNDPSFGITLPLEISVISDKDLSYPDFRL
jgi:dTDP-4-dehydrorhamnose 3,5-epimerase